MPKLTKTVVENATPRDKQFSLWCSDLKGFGVLINPTGKRTYVVDYRTADSARRRMSIGVHGQITCEQARKLALETLGSTVIRKVDPLDERRTRRQAMTVAELCDSYLKAMDKGLILGKGGRPKKASTIEIDAGRIRRHIVPLIGKKKVIDVTTSDVSKFMRDVTTGKSAADEKTGKKRGRAIVEGGAGTASRTVGLLGSIFSFAIAEGVIKTNPVHGVKRPADGKRQRRLSEAEYRFLGKAMDEAEAEGETWQAVLGIRLLALTACRLSEIVSLEWDEVDIHGQALRLSDSKTGSSVRPIGQAALDIFNAVPAAYRQSPYVLPSIRSQSSHYGGMPAAWKRIAKRAKLEGATMHTLRHSFASVAGDLGFSELTIAGLLGHRAATTTAKYVHHADAAMIAAANRVAAEIERQLSGKTAKVIAFPAVTG